MAHSDTTFLKYAKKQYKVWKRSYKKRNTKHSDKVKEINEIFNLKDTNELATKSVPGFWAGDIDNPKPRFIVISLNPGRKHKDAHGLSHDEKKSAKENGARRPRFPQGPSSLVVSRCSAPKPWRRAWGPKALCWCARTALPSWPRRPWRRSRLRRCPRRSSVSAR